MTRRAPKMSLTRVSRTPVTVAEWDATPGLHEWIEGEIRRREQAAHAAQRACGSWEYDSFVHEVRDRCNAGTVATVPLEGPGEFIALNGPDVELRRCASGRKILAAHPYTTRVVNPGYGAQSAGFGCETCHDWDGVPEGRGNCATILALAEGYGLEPAGESDVEVVRD